MKSLMRVLGFIAVLASVSPASAGGFQTVSKATWTRDAVERVLHAFAYGGRVSEAQIETWVARGPTAAIQEMLTLQPTNPVLAPPTDTITPSVSSLVALQSRLEADTPSNPLCPGKRALFATYGYNKGDAFYSKYGLERTWLAAAHLRGSNPFRHKVGLWLTNYLMATSETRTRLNLIRDHYDATMALLAKGRPFWEVLAAGAASAAVAMEYGHQKASYDNVSKTFSGSDDFAREYFQLFFKIDGTSDGADYHEQVTIENTALLLTGFGIDQQPAPAGVPLLSNSLWVAPIDFTDHVDGMGVRLNNQSMHHQAPLEILKTTITGINGEEKLRELSRVAILHPDSLDTLPLEIVRFFGDEDLTPQEEAIIRSAWRDVVGKPNDLLTFLRRYAISTTFHNPSTYKYKTSFEQNIIPWNIANATNDFFYSSGYTPQSELEQQFVEPFYPQFRIFGHQTGLTAVNDGNVFRLVYNFAATNSGFSASPIYCKDAQGNTLYSWSRDWRAILPANDAGQYPVGAVARWLWQRLTGDSGTNLTLLERAHLAAILARRTDLATVIDPRQPTAVYTAATLQQEPYASLIANLEASLLPLADANVTVRDNANYNIGMAVNFLRATPFAFAMEGR